jgi:hypothetical protein
MSCSGAGGGWPWRASGRSRTSLTILGMHPGTLRKEVRRAEADSGRRPDLLSSGEREEIRRLRRENYPLRHANGILRSASLFSRASSTRTVRRASPPLEGRADPPHRGRVGVHLLPAQDRPAQRAGGRGRAAAGPHPRVPCRELLRLWLPAHLEGAAVRWRRGRSRPGQAADACPPNSGRQAQRQAVAHHQTGPGPPPAARLVQRDLSAGRAGPAVGRRSVLPALPGGGLCSRSSSTRSVTRWWAGSSPPTCAPPWSWTRCGRRSEHERSPLTSRSCVTRIAAAGTPRSTPPRLGRPRSSGLGRLGGGRVRKRARRELRRQLKTELIAARVWCSRPQLDPRPWSTSAREGWCWPY